MYVYIYIDQPVLPLFLFAFCCFPLRNYGMVYDENHFYRRLKFCKGYVVRHPFNEGIEKAVNRKAGGMFLS